MGTEQRGTIEGSVPGLLLPLLQHLFPAIPVTGLDIGTITGNNVSFTGMPLHRATR